MIRRCWRPGKSDVYPATPASPAGGLMHSIRASLLLLSLMTLAACRADETPSAPRTPSSPSLSVGSEGIGDFHRYVALGTSVSMGVQSDGVYEAGQRTAWPAQLAAMA